MMFFVTIKFINMDLIEYNPDYYKKQIYQEIYTPLKLCLNESVCEIKSQTNIEKKIKKVEKKNKLNSK